MLTVTAKRNIVNISLIVLSVAILLSVGFTVYVRNAPKNVIRIKVRSDETQVVSFGSMELRPGEACEYQLVLDGKDVKQAEKLLLRFEDRAPTLTLKNYACVRVERDGEVLCDALLAEMLAQEEFSVPAGFSDKRKQKFKITFYMPEDVGNEAQNAEANFQLLVAASNE